VFGEMKTSHELLRGVKTKKSIWKIQKLSDSETRYWKKYLEDNEKRIIEGLTELN
jgi:serine kinase of HPr protein (carbohydrate metabolism regulator)